MRKECPNCGGYLVSAYVEGTFDWKPEGFWRVFCEDCGKIFIHETTCAPDCPAVEVEDEADEGEEEGK